MAWQQRHVVDLFLDVCPSFAPKWAEHQVPWDGKAGLYNDLAELADYLVWLMQQQATTELAPVFTVIERLLLEGDTALREAIIVGLLEDIQTIAGHRGVDRQAFEPYLKPETVYWWSRVIDFWDAKIPYIYDDRRGE